jgi:MoxR-like ATPase
VDQQQVVELQNRARHIQVDETIYDYILDLVEATRRSDQLQVGVSTRGSISLYRAAQALAMIEERDYVIPDDVKQLAVPVLAHRVITTNYFQSGQRTEVEAIIQQILDQTPVPV